MDVQTYLPTYVRRSEVRAYAGYIILKILILLWIHVTLSSWRKLFRTLDLTKYNKLLKISFGFNVTTIT